jgi:1-deoxy-D-xylulose-5-phosphate reductoisomerase
VLNAANEVAVGAFLNGRLAFTGITALIDRVMQMHTVGVAGTLDEVLVADAWARTRAEAQLLNAVGKQA